MKPKFLFIQSEHENIGVEYLSAALKLAGFEVDLLFFPKQFDNGSIKLFVSDEKKENSQILTKIKEYKPNIVCYSPFSSQYFWATKKAKFIKSKFPEIFNLFGGVHVNSVPEVVIKNKIVDGILVGEGDYTIVEFAKKFNKKTYYGMKSFWGKKKNKLIKNNISCLPKDLDILPYPDKELFYTKIPKSLQDSSYVIMGSRGCPFACTYCSNNVYQELYKGQNRLRFRSPENIIKELEEAKKRYTFDRVEFMDDVLTIDQDRLGKLLKIYHRRINLPFSCFLHPQFVTEKMIKMLKTKGCFWLKMGVQSANEDFRKKYLNRFESNEELIRISKLCHKYKLRFSFDHIFNLPGESKADLIEAVKLYNLCKPSIINFGSLIYLPKTKIIKYGLEEKIINSRDVWLINRGKDPVFQSSNINRLSCQSKHREKVNISAFSFLFILTTITPKFFIDFLLSIKFYDISITINSFILIIFKTISKIKARQFYIYYGVLKNLVIYTLVSKKIIKQGI